MNLTHEKSWYARKWSMDVLVDIIGGIFIAVGLPQPRNFPLWG